MKNPSNITHYSHPAWECLHNEEYSPESDYVPLTLCGLSFKQATEQEALVCIHPKEYKFRFNKELKIEASCEACKLLLLEKFHICNVYNKES